MTPASIIEEHAKGTGLLQSHIDGFTAEGVAAINLGKTWCGEYAWVNRDRVVFTNEDRFEFKRHHRGDEPGRGVFTFVCFDQDGQPADIAAYRPPNLAFWLGRVTMLGEEQVLGPRLGEPLRVHATIMSWLGAAREGVWIADYAQAAYLLRAESLSVDTEDHARFLRKKLTLSAPPVHVLRTSGALAA